jgi:sialate O-acetylesterase
MRLMLPDSSEPGLPLAGKWKYRNEHNFGYVTATPRKSPDYGGTLSILYGSKILPLAPVALKGAIWYQGESNSDAPDLYRTLFPALIRDWRRTFGQPRMPFYFVQLANFTALQKAPVEPGWAELREAQMQGLNEPNTGVALALDVGDADDIHPKNKQDVGKRLALVALAKTYGKSLDYSGPMFKSHQVEGSAIRVRFEHAGGLKTTDGGPVKGFAIAGATGPFVWADARIDGETVVVQSSQVPAPVKVRYGWANNPLVNLVNSAGLPASPFRTDVES